MSVLPQPQSEAEVLRAGVAILKDRLPAGWGARLSEELPDRGFDALLTVTAPDGTSATLLLEARRVVEGRDVAEARERLARYVQQTPGACGVVVARYLSSPVRKRLADAGLSYVDATGNVLVNVARPGLYVATDGADHDPWRGPGRPRGTLKGAPAARVVRALLDHDRSWAIRELVRVTGGSMGSAYRVIEFLESENLAIRDESGAVSVPDWAALLRRWSLDYAFVRNNDVTRWIAPRGLPDLLRRAADSSVRYAVTGTLAAAEWAAYAPARSAMIYVADADEAAGAWGLRAADAGANVMLGEPQIDVAFARTLVTAGDLVVAAPTQVAVDLMTGPGRNPNEAEELIEWMARHEPSWRR